jgi:hypothetical protein
MKYCLGKYGNNVVRGQSSFEEINVICSFLVAHSNLHRIVLSGNFLEWHQAQFKYRDGEFRSVRSLPYSNNQISVVSMFFQMRMIRQVRTLSKFMTYF